MTKAYQDVYYQTRDNLKLYARDYQNPGAEKTILCLHGFTRNSADFADLSEQLHGDYRIIVPDQRGRGLSDYDKITSNYNPATYVADMFELLGVLSIDNVHIIGTSMGGVMAMSMAGMRPELVSSVVLNDIAPDVHAEGLQRIYEYLGNKPKIESWQDAVNYSKEVNTVVYPNYSESQWYEFARKVYCEDSNGIPVASYDTGIADMYKGFDAKTAPLDLWPLFDAAKNTLFMFIRGELSDIVAHENFAKLGKIDNVLATVEVAGVGHAPMLDEDGVVPAIKKFLKNT